MSRVISVDANNDLYIGADGSLAMSTALEAVLQACEQAAKTQLGELMYATNQGLPNFAAVWDGAPNLLQFEAYLRRTLSGVEGVTGIESLSTSIAANKLSYLVTIQTIYGLGAING